MDKAFATHCADSKLPRTLGTRLRNAGLFVNQLSYFSIINTARYDDYRYCEMMVPFIVTYVKRQKSVPDDEPQAWAEE
jgi:hypothetical protein